MILSIKIFNKLFLVNIYLFWNYPLYNYAWLPEDYPEYCNKQLDSFSIPSLSPEDEKLVYAIKQTHVFLTPGARAPISKLRNCWPGYSYPRSSCNVTEYLLPPSPSAARGEVDSDLIFRKRYDDVSGSNCLSGQLLDEGYRQIQQNGLNLRKAYLQHHNPLLNLLPIRGGTGEQLQDGMPVSQLYMQSDDTTHSILTAQIALQYLLEDNYINNNKQENNIQTAEEFSGIEQYGYGTPPLVIDHHIDYGVHPLDPLHDMCPLLVDVTTSSYLSKEWTAINTSAEMIQLNKDLTALFGGLQYFHWDSVLDCVMTSVCTDTDISPVHTNGNIVMSDKLLYQIQMYHENEFGFLYLFNNSEFAKLALFDAIKDMKNHIQDMLMNTNTNTDNYYKFILSCKSEFIICIALVYIYLYK